MQRAKKKLNADKAEHNFVVDVKILNLRIVAGSFRGAAKYVKSVISTAQYLHGRHPVFLKQVNVGMAYMTQYCLFARESIPKYEQLEVVLEHIIATGKFHPALLDLPMLDLSTAVSW